ncbi:HEPN domain-containing protein [Enterococcus malodoratus]|uniref:HEPN domain-containing protein n=1 Tax=Enterococcus malodoratus TaxID=71451 RepID=UPI003FD4CE77
MDLSWYRNIYWRFCNDQRSLVDDKFKDILKLHLQIEHVIDSATLTIFDFSKVFGDSESLESYLLKELNTLADVRNGIAHGVDNGYDESDYKQLFEKMIVIQAQVISTLKNSEFFIFLIVKLS